MPQRIEFERDLFSASGLTLLVDGDAQSHVDLDDATRLFFEYTRRIGHVFDVVGDPQGAPTAPIRALHLGGGAFTLPRYLAATRPGSDQLVVEIDAELVALVQEQAPLPPRSGITVTVADAATEVGRLAAGHPFDVVVVDLYVGLHIPAFALTADFVTACARLVAPGGALVWNIADVAGLGRLTTLVELVRRTTPMLALVAAGTSDVVDGTAEGNIVLVAATQPSLSRIAQALGERGPFPVAVRNDAAPDSLQARMPEN
ncbi:MAG TPA: fused MFS/spermidine synthase [Candidatus Lumbricidophila sp.]|nr:fused MFS/spermidine synthase [Candidatus Lumbricidophila sp.]